VCLLVYLAGLQDEAVEGRAGFGVGETNCAVLEKGYLA